MKIDDIRSIRWSDYSQNYLIDHPTFSPVLADPTFISRSRVTVSPANFRRNVSRKGWPAWASSAARPKPTIPRLPRPSIRFRPGPP